jgi:glycerol uptake facilitator-like aquaporin
MQMPPESKSEKKGSDHLWALWVPLIMVLTGGLVGLLMLDVLGAGHLRAIFGRLF